MLLMRASIAWCLLVKIFQEVSDLLDQGSSSAYDISLLSGSPSVFMINKRHY